MKIEYASAWVGIAERNPVVAAVDALLRGTGQVMFQNNPLTGLLFLIGIFVNSPRFGGAALMGVATSTLAAWLLGADRALIRNGLFGFNGVLTGIGLAFFLQLDALLIVYIMLGAAVSTVVMLALVNLLGPWDMPALTAPFVITTWLLLFAVYQFGFLAPTELISPTALDPLAQTQTALRPLATGARGAGLTLANLANGFFRGVGEVMFQDNLLSGVIFLLAILISSRISFVFAALGSAVGMLTALALGADGFSVYHGLFGFNAVLCAIALGGLFFVLTWKSAIYALVAAVMGSVAFAAIAVLLSPLGMPALTAPFVLVTWLFLLPKAGFRALRPVPLAEVTTPEKIRASFALRQAAAQ
ncbi:MAG: urea transporter [Egibacteraceae bacterium]